MEPDKSQKNRSDGSTVPSDQMKESPVSNNLLHPHSAENQGTKHFQTIQKVILKLSFYCWLVIVIFIFP